MVQKEIILRGGRTADIVVRIGAKVHRTKSQNSEFSQALLIHLESHNFKYSPRFLGIDDQGREILSYFEGEVPIGNDISLAQMIQCAKAIRELHDVASLSPLRQECETICHLDFAPWNVIFKDGAFVGVIDFDDSRPGRRVDDLAYLIWTFLDLGISERNDETQISHILELSKAYCLSEPLQLTDAILNQQQRILKFRKDIVEKETAQEKRNFSKKAIKNIEKSLAWVRANALAINKLLLS